MNLIIPEDTEVTESNINSMQTTPAAIVNGNLVPTTSVGGNTTSVGGRTTNVTNNGLTTAVNNSIFTTQTKLENSNTNLNNLIEDVIDYEYQSMFNKARNFMQYPDEQKYCPNIDNSESSFWVQLPEDYVRPGDRVVLKPNWVKEHDERHPGPDQWEHVVTHPSVIESVIRWVAKHLKGNGSITCGLTNTYANFQER